MDISESHILINDEKPRYYEPWRPELGQRVRVRLSAECNKTWSAPFEDTPGHPPEEDGRLGTVLELWPQYDHPYGVRFDEPIAVTGPWARARDRTRACCFSFHSEHTYLPAPLLCVGCFAAVELEPIDE